MKKIEDWLFKNSYKKKSLQFELNQSQIFVSIYKVKEKIKIK